ncbi:MAG: hypothetical protein OHK006_19820 [Thermodesulfovibrionales bacterium]
MQNAFAHLEKLFEIRNEITLGVAADSLVVDEYTLDRNNPVFREFAQSLHAKGIASVTFMAGMTPAELFALHEIITLKDLSPDVTVPNLAREKELRRIILTMLDLSHFSFLEGARRGGEQGSIWEDYVHGLLAGKLGGEGADGFFLAPPEAAADAVNQAMTHNARPESYDRVITAYMKKKGQVSISSESLQKFYSFVEKLRPELKRQFLSRSFTHLSADVADVERALGDMSHQDFEKIVEMLTRHASLIPETLKNLIDKLSAIKKTDQQAFGIVALLNFMWVAPYRD